MTDLIGQFIGKYQILEKLGQGGMAAVFKAFDSNLGIDVAIKIIRRDAFPTEIYNRILFRFEREAKALAILSHPNIVKFYDYGVYENAPYLVMELVKGGTLKDRIGKPIPYPEAAHILRPIAQGLAYAHQWKIFHRDIKPSNILITDNGKPILTDFGIAKLLEDSEGLTLTGTGVGIGTPEYMAPEQGLGKEIDARADIYSLGVVFYEMVTGITPFKAETPFGILNKQVNEPLPDPRIYIPDLPETVANVLFTALEKKPENRYEDMADFVKVLEKIENYQLIIQTPKRTLPGEETVKGIDNRKSQSGEKKRKSKKSLFWKILLFFLGLLSVWFILNKMHIIPDITISPDDQIDSTTEKDIQKETINFIDSTKINDQRVDFIAASQTVLADIQNTATKIIQLTATQKNFNQHLSATEESLKETQFAFYSTLTAQSWTATPIPTRPVTSIYVPTQIPVLTNQPISSASKQVQNNRIREKDNMKMVFIPAGEFMMGTEGGEPDEDPVHTVYLNEFWIDKTEITNGKYAKCVSDGVCTKPESFNSYTRDSYFTDNVYGSYPVINVNWYQASTYCEWAGGRLPTEAEWEKAARGMDGRKYPWGDTIQKDNANYGSFIGDTTEVGYYPSGASFYGVLDMAGNVWEWVSDWYDETYYNNSPNNNPTGPETGEAKVLRGGSWYYENNNARSSDRLSYRPEISQSVLGFRCAFSETVTDPSTEEISNTPIQTTPSIPDSNSFRIREKDNMMMVYIPAGEFMMGTEGGKPDEDPAHTVYLNDFWIDKTEITNGKYAKCVSEGVCTKPESFNSYTRDSYFTDNLYGSYPVINVNWYQASTYCEWAGGRLPTEAEWEKAARGTDGRKYPWGDTIQKDNANYGSFIDDTTKVGYYPSGASPYGVLDMAGNVWEWVSDWYDETYYNISPNNNPTGPETGEAKVLRGGSWSSNFDNIRISNRSSNIPKYWFDVYGFRCASSF